MNLAWSCWLGTFVFAWSLVAPMTRARGALLGTNLFPADNPWNQNISQAPVATNSATIMTNIIGTNFNGRFHPDFGQDDRQATNDLYGIPFNVVHGNSMSNIHVVIDAYSNESDVVDAPIPTNA